MHRYSLIFFLALGTILFPDITAGEVDPYQGRRGYSGVLFDTPVYDPHSNSYFMLIENKAGGTYAQARKFARSRTFKGVRGRLAIIRSRETQELINRTIRPYDEAWIGLRMFCHRRVLFWADGKKIKRGQDYTNWGPRWHYAKYYIPCLRGQKWAGVTLAPLNHAGYAGNGLRWFVLNPKHGVDDSIIEFPMGARKSKPSASNQSQ